MNVGQIFQEILINSVGTITGGIVLTLILFITNERIFSRKNISGVWIVEVITNSSTYNPFIAMSVFFEIHLLQQGAAIHGSGEKIKEISKEGVTLAYEAGSRITIEITGHYEKYYLKKSRLYLNIIEKGRIRESRSTYDLIIHSQNMMTGLFTSTAATSKGSVKINRS